METIHAWIEGFLRGRYGLAELGPRSFRVLALAVLIGAIVVAGWLLLDTLRASMLIPRYLDFPPTARW